MDCIVHVDVHSCHLLFVHFQFAFIHGPNISGSYAILLFTASNLAYITSPIHNWVLFLLWLHLFILSGVISPLISSSLLGAYRPEEFLFQYPIFLPFHTVHGVLRASLVAQRLKHLTPVQETQVRSLGREDPLEKEMATHSSILAWRIPWTEEPSGLQSTG